MNQIARERFGPDPPVPHLDLEGEVELADISEPVVSELQRLEPFGAGNPDPLFAARNLRLAGNPELVGSKRTHLSFLARQGDVTLRVIAFGKADWLPELSTRRGEPFALAFEPTISTFGERRVELRAEDIQWESQALIEMRSG
jgi:single-stranded-DNA-specific exonuclease